MATVARGSGFLASAKGQLSRSVGFLGRIGKALLFPIAALPIAAILLRIGAAIPVDPANNPNASEFAKGVASFISNSGQFVFSNLYIVFGVGVAFGLTRDNRGEAALVGLLGILLLSTLIRTGGADLPNKIYGGLDLPLAPGVPPDVPANTIVTTTTTTTTTITNTITNTVTPGAVIDPSVTAVEGFKRGATGFHRLFSSKLQNGDVYDAVLAQNVLAGFASGALVAFIYNRFNSIELPSVLGFFSGRRLVPVLGILGVMIFAVLWAIVFPWVGYVLFLFSEALSNARGNRFANAGIMGVYAILNRLLIPFGLHHIPNTLFWFTVGSGAYTSVTPIATGGFTYGAQIPGDIFGFLNGVSLQNGAGTFQTGFFPIMMFGLPAMIAAFWFTADNKDQKRNVIALYGSAALISFLTGITEPIEFAFLFIAPALYGLHVLLSGVFAFITGLFGIQLGFGFSAGLIDYGLSLPKSIDIINANVATTTAIERVFANPGWIWPIGALTAGTYFGLSSLMIKKLNLPTPGRGKNQIEKAVVVTSTGQQVQVDVVAGGASASSLSVGPTSARASAYVKALGGYENITNFQNCTVRLRYDVKDSSIVDDEALKKAGAKGVVHVGKKHVQVVVGLDVEKLNNEIIAGKPRK